MDKVIVVAFLAVIGVVVWAVLPPPAATGPAEGKASASTKSVMPTPNASQLINPRRIAKSRVPGKTAMAQKDVPPVKGRQTAKVKSKTKPDGPNTPYPDYDQSPNAAIPAGAKRIPWPVVTTGEFAVKGHVDEDAEPVDIYKHPPEDDPFPHFGTRAFKDSIRNYYGGLPAQGKLPDKVLAADVLPSSVMGSLHLPAETELTMLGPHYTNDVRAYKVALSIPEDQSSVFGLSYVTPDGQSHRQYIRLNVEGK